MTNQQNYRPVLKQLLEALTKHPDFKSIKEKFDKDMLATAAYEACAILDEKTRIREQAQSFDAAMKAYVEMYPTPNAPVEEAEEFDPSTGMWLGKPGTFNSNDPFIIPQKPIAEAGTDDLFILIPDGTGQQVDESAKNDNPWFDFPETGGSDDDDFYVETFGL
jgi:hypothetical protein